MKKSVLLFVFCVALLASCKGPVTRTASLECDVTTLRHFPYSQQGVRVIMHEECTPVEGMLGFEKVETYFVNQGKPITVRAYDICRTFKQLDDTIAWSLQPSSTNGRMDWVLPIKPGFSKENYLGMNNSDYGGGIPVLDVWQRDGGEAIGLLEPVLHNISMPVRWSRYSNVVRYSLHYNLPEPIELAEGDTLRCFTAFRYKHTGDYFNALRAFSQVMQQECGIQLPESEPEAFEPVWCAWGYERTFTMNEVIGTLDKAAELGFRWVDVDDGYQIAEGDWETNSRFPGGDNDMRRLANEIHKRGMLAKLWWAPLAADPGTRCLKEHPEMQLKTDEWSPQYITWWDSYYLSPVNPVTKAYTLNLVDRFMKTWDFDGLKIDGQHLNCCPNDYNDASELEYPEQSYELLPTFFQAVYDEAHALKEHAVIQICPCGCAINYFLLPTFNQAVASDPTSSMQVRMKRKAYAAMAPGLAYYGDHVELTDDANDFASQIGIGAVIGTKFTYPKDNPNASESFLLTPEKEQLIRHWMKIFKDKNLARGEYLNLYTWGYDYPEAHVIRQNDAMYYSFYAPEFEGQLELRGLEPGREYTVTEYAADQPREFTINGSNPVIDAQFVRNYLIEVK